MCCIASESFSSPAKFISTPTETRREAERHKTCMVPVWWCWLLWTNVCCKYYSLLLETTFCLFILCVFLFLNNFSMKSNSQPTSVFSMFTADTRDMRPNEQLWIILKNVDRKFSWIWLQSEFSCKDFFCETKV